MSVRVALLLYSSRVTVQIVFIGGNVLGLFDWRRPLTVLSRFRLLSGILVCLGRLLQLSLDIGPQFSGGCFLDYFLLLDVEIDQIFYIFFRKFNQYKRSVIVKAWIINSHLLFN